MKYSETQYNVFDRFVSEYGLYQLGPMASFTFNNDPKRLLFVLSRYKFVSKMVRGRSAVLEIGCGDGFGSRLVRQSVDSLTVTDFDENLLRHVLQNSAPKGLDLIPVCWDPLKEEYPGSARFDAVFALDVLEHIPKNDEDKFIKSALSVLRPSSICIVGMPSFESQAYASEESRLGHVNCKTAEELYELFSEYFDNVLSFSMNDEVVHTGFSRMANYLFVVCSGKKTHRPVPDNLPLLSGDSR